MSFEILLVAGGKGTRSVNPQIPKSLQLVNGEPLIFHQLVELNSLSITHSIPVTIVTGYKSELVKDYIYSVVDKFPNLIIRVVKDLKQTGTFNPVYLNSFDTAADYTLVILGDLFFKLNVNTFNSNLSALLNKGVDIGIFLHPNDHPNDSDLVSVDPIDFRVSQIYLKNLTIDQPRGNLAIAGFFVIRNSTVRQFKEFEGDLVSNFILKSVQAEKSVKGIISIDVIADMGTQDRINKIESRKFHLKSINQTRVNKGALFLDLDDTLIKNCEIKNRQSLIDINHELINLMLECNVLGIPILLVSNQPGIAKGFFTIKDMENFLRSLETQLADSGVYIDDHIICPHHPESGWADEIVELKFACDCRKPKIGMFTIMSKKHSIDLTRSLFVGDSIVDKEAASACGVKYIEFSPGIEMLQHRLALDFLRRDIFAQ